MKHMKKGGNTRHRPFTEMSFLTENMRRKELEITDFNEIIKIIKKNRVLVLGLTDKDKPYLVPLNYVEEITIDRISIYFHCALSGKKLDLIRKNYSCSFVIYNDFGVERLEEEQTATTRYESIIGSGTVEILVESKEKETAGLALLAKYDLSDLPLNQKALDGTCFCKITVEEISGKTNKERA